jgi:hypothetical protein
LHAGIEKPDFKGVIRHRSGRANQLIETLRRHDALSISINIDAGRINRSARSGTSSITPKIASSTRAAMQPY